MLPVFADNFLKGLMTTVIKQSPISFSYMIIIYVIYVWKTTLEYKKAWIWWSFVFCNNYFVIFLN